MIALSNLHVYIQTLQPSIQLFTIPLITLHEPPTLLEFRTRLQNSALGNAEFDIFFPGWTHTPYIYPCEDGDPGTLPEWHQVEEKKITVDSDDKLRHFLDKEQQKPGWMVIVVQQTRSKRYSRKKDCDFQPSSPTSIKSMKWKPSSTIYFNPPFLPYYDQQVYYDASNLQVVFPSMNQPFYPQCYAIPVPTVPNASYYSSMTPNLMYPTNTHQMPYYAC